MKLHEKLNNLNKYPLHMPGHKRNAKFGITGAERDITEIDGYDNLHDARDSILEIELSLKKIYKSHCSFLLINGTTAGILASIFAICNEGDKILIAPNCHKSVYSACLLRRLRVVFIPSMFDCSDGYYTRITQQQYDETLRQNPDAKAAVITSPSYEGSISRIKSEIPLITDCAHGAHLGISYFPEYPKSDIVISSLHKTLPALTQVSVCNVYNKKYEQRVKFFLDIFQTSSPSYILMDSADICCDYVLNNKRAFDDYYSVLMDFRCELELHRMNLKYSDDPSKIIISVADTNITGAQLGNMLRNEYNFEPEMCSITYVILMTSVGDEPEMFAKLKTALEEIDSNILQKYTPARFNEPKICSEWEPYEIQSTKGTPLSDSVEKVSAEFVYAYPPDIPILMPNKIITTEDTALIKKSSETGVTLVSDSGMIPNKILTKAE